jgi:hypothetical protein
MDPVSALRLNRLDFRAKVGEVSGQNGRCNFDRAIK